MIANTKSSAASNGAIYTNGHHTKELADALALRPSNFEQDVRIRQYQDCDHEAISRLCYETGFLGRPVNALFCDQELFADLFTRPYLRYEPESTLIAEANGKVVGYLLGSVCRHFDWLQMWSGFQTASKMVFRLASGCYAGHHRSRKFVRWLYTSGFWEQPRHPRRAGHLHLEIDKAYRGRGLGRRLWSIYETRLREQGIERCYGAFFSHPERRPEAAYVRYGFTVYDRRRTTLFEPEIADPVEVVCVSKNL